MAESSSLQANMIERMTERCIQALQPMHELLISIASNIPQTQPTNETSQGTQGTTNPPPDPFLECLRHDETKLGRKLRDMEILRIELQFNQWVGNRFWYSTQSTTVSRYYKDFCDWKSWVDVRQGEEDSEEFLVRIFVRGLREEIKTRVRSLSPISVVQAFKIASIVEVELKEATNLYDELPMRKFLTTHLSIENKESKNDENKVVVPIIPRNIEEVGILQVTDYSKERQDRKEISFSEIIIATEFSSPNNEVYADSINTHRKVFLNGKVDIVFTDIKHDSSSLVQDGGHRIKEFEHLRFYINAQFEDLIFDNTVGLPYDGSKRFVKNVLQQFGKHNDWLIAVGVIEFRIVQLCEDSLGNFKPYQWYMIFHKWRDIVWLIFRDVVTESHILRALLSRDAAIFHKWKDRGGLLHGCWLAALSVFLNIQIAWLDYDWMLSSWKFVYHDKFRRYIVGSEYRGDERVQYCPLPQEDVLAPQHMADYEQIKKNDHHEDMVNLEARSNDTARHDHGKRMKTKQGRGREATVE